jgi:hypothetical protein
MNQLLCPFYLQQEDGSLPDRFGPDSVLWACSKPPVHGWCMTKLMAWHEYDEQTLRTVYHHLEKWTDWWMTCRVYAPDSPQGHIWVSCTISSAALQCSWLKDLSIGQ